MIITETWLLETDGVIVGECTPYAPSYDFLNYIRGGTNYGGGIGIVYKKTLNLKAVPVESRYRTFEHCMLCINSSIKVSCIYRPFPSRKNGFKTPEFMEEIEQFLDEICVVPEKLCILGDFNLHIEDADDGDTKKFMVILNNTGLYQFVSEPTHVGGGILDLVIARIGDDLVQNVEVDPIRYSDHHFVSCIYQCAKPPPMMITTKSREYGKIDHDLLKSLLEERFEDFSDSNDPDTLVQAYESITSSVLDEVCPIVEKTRTIKPRLPWFNDDIHKQRCLRRKLERKWKKSRSVADELAFRSQKDHVCTLITNAKIVYFTDKCANASVKEVYNTINVLLNKPRNVLPDYHDKLASEFLAFFVNKVETIRNKVSAGLPLTNKSNQTSCAGSSTMTGGRMGGFTNLTPKDVKDIIMKFASKSSILDSLPSWLVKENLPTLLPVITDIVNTSLSSGIFPNSLKRSVIRPVIKKSNMDRNSLKSYRPVANISLLSKIVEKAAACQITDYVDSYSLSERLQSAYKKNHSTETALLEVKNSLLESLDHGNAVLMVLLDMSAAFDTVDHNILLARMESRFGMTGKVISWYETYLKNRTTKVVIKDTYSAEHCLTYSLPQGSIIGPQGFTLYTTPVGDIIRDFEVSFHKYADDIQLFIEFNPKVKGNCESALGKLRSCIIKINEWMTANMLQLNQEKTEFILFANSRVLPNLVNIELNLGNICIYPKSSVKNLGVILDSSLNMSSHINSLCTSINYHIRNLWRIRRFISQEACHNAVRGLVLSRLDYANSLLLGAREKDLLRLQRIQNKAARLTFACGRDQPSAGLMDALHWLPIKQRIHFKCCVYVFKCIHKLAPSYLTDHIQLQSSVSFGLGQRLRSSSDFTRLHVPRSHRKAGDVSFTIGIPKLWNELPIKVREAGSLPEFKCLLKTHLYPVL
jgi:hypothetical protein